MYTSLKRIAILSLMLAIFNAVATLLLIFYFIQLGSFAAIFTWILYTFTATIGFLLISWALFDLSKMLERENDFNSEYIHDLAKRVKELESRI